EAWSVGHHAARSLVDREAIETRSGSWCDHAESVSHGEERGSLPHECECVDARRQPAPLENKVVGDHAVRSAGGEYRALACGVAATAVQIKVGAETDGVARAELRRFGSELEEVGGARVAGRKGRASAVGRRVS